VFLKILLTKKEKKNQHQQQGRSSLVAVQELRMDRKLRSGGAACSSPIPITNRSVRGAP